VSLRVVESCQSNAKSLSTAFTGVLFSLCRGGDASVVLLNIRSKSCFCKSLSALDRIVLGSECIALGVNPEYLSDILGGEDNILNNSASVSMACLACALWLTALLACAACSSVVFGCSDRGGALLLLLLSVVF